MNSWAVLGGLVVLLAISKFSLGDEEECIDGPSTWYTGTRNTTASGIPCQRWDVDKPHKPKHVPKDGGNHNYCRNPDNDLRGTWCYTTNNDTRWEYCNITKCPDDSLVIWTNYDASSESTHLLRVQADPEIVKQETDSSGSFNVTVLTGSNRSMTEYWALSANYNKKMIYFTDYRSEYVGTWHMTNKESKQYFEGMAHGIECIAYDWVTHNLYWTDSEFKWVMAAESTFNYYTPVYRTNPDPAYGLAVHSVQRLLIFSTYKALGSKIIVTDLAGKNEKILFKFPSVFDVTGISIDYTDDRIYWTDFTGYGGMVMSSLLDGTNKTQHHYRGGSIFWGVAAYMNYLYVTDVHARYSMTGSRFYSVWIITKQTKQVFRYTLSGKPRGVAVYSANEEYSPDIPPTSGECKSGETCGHLCLPRINATRVCACSLGYHLQTSTNTCKPKLINDEYLLVADAGQGKVFQIPIKDIENNASVAYSIVPLGHDKKTITVAVDPVSQYLYWSEKKKPSVNRAIMDGSRYTNIANSYANSIVIDPHTGNLFYSDNDKDSIMVSSNDGDKQRTIVKPEQGKSNATSIRMIVQDIKYKYIYWTDTYSKEGEGKVMRCRFDGTEKTVVLEKLNWPHAITIDYKTNRMYVAEAKTAMIYELDLANLVTINNTSIQQKQIKQYDVSAYISRISPYLIDMKIYGGMAYIMDGKSSRLERFNLTAGPQSMTPYGPAEFFRVTTLSVYSNKFYTQYIKPNTNPCEKMSCRSICVAVSDTVGKCICEDGRRSVGPICIDDPNQPVTDITPPVYENCPDDAEISLPSCSATVSFSWSVPTWTDDKTDSAKIVTTNPSRSNPAIIGAGRHEFTHTARDEQGNIGYCRFIITVKDNQCGPVPNARASMKRTEPTCGNREGSEFNVTCIEPGYVVYVSPTRQFAFYQVSCSRTGQWVSSMTTLSDCRPGVQIGIPTASTTTMSTAPTKTSTPSAKPTTSASTTTPRTTTTTTTPTTTTAKPTTTTTATTTTATTQTTTTTTAAPTTIKPTTTTKKPTTTKRITTTTLPPTTTIKTTTTTTSTPAKTNKPTTATAAPLTTTIIATSTTLATSKPSNATAGKEGVNASPSKSSGGLSGGVVAAIVILVIVLIIVIAVVVFVTMRNRPVWAVSKLSFPVFWKSVGDDSVKMESSNNSYQIMT